MMETLAQRANRIIPLGVNTSSKAACRFAEGYGPTHILYGNGASVTTSDGRTLIDWAMGLGPVTVGHGDDDISAAVMLAIYGGVSHTLPTRLEVEVAELLHESVPGAEMVRFLKSGSDACAAAVRLARAYMPGHDKIVRCGYHGWHDWAMNADYQDKHGIPQCVRDLTISVPFNDPEALEDEFLKGGVAAFILEPVSLTMPCNRYLPKVRDLCDRYGVVLIFDEVITGIRMGLGGAAEHFGVTPDLICLGKGLANGYPLAALVGSSHLMRCFEQTHISGTYNGETASLAAALATIKKLTANDFWAHQERVGNLLISAYQLMVGDFGLQAHTKIVGMPHFTSVQWTDPAYFTLFQQEMIRAGILFSGSQFPCLAHGPSEIGSTIRAYRTSGAVVADAIRAGTVASKLQCTVNRPIFRRQ